MGPLTAAPMQGYDRRTASRIRALLAESGLLTIGEATARPVVS